MTEGGWWLPANPSSGPFPRPQVSVLLSSPGWEPPEGGEDLTRVHVDSFYGGSYRWASPWGHPSLEESGQNPEFPVGLPTFLLAILIQNQQTGPSPLGERSLEARVGQGLREDTH